MNKAQNIYPRLKLQHLDSADAAAFTSLGRRAHWHNDRSTNRGVVCVSTYIILAASRTEMSYLVPWYIVQNTIQNDSS